MTENLENPFTQKELPVLITLDVCDGSFDQGERKPRFRDLMETLPGMRDLIGEVISARKVKGLPVTWFIRADMQVKENTGNAMGLFLGWRDFWDGVRASGSECAWHPHLYKRHGHKWTTIREPGRLKAEADKIRHEMSGEEWKPTTCRIGESVGSNELMGFLDSIGILADSSALPGRKRDDGLRWFDWSGTPTDPYRPARGDYRRPSRARGAGDRAEGEESLSILEIPFTMAGIRAPYDKVEASGTVRRYMDLSFAPELLEKAVSRIVHNVDYLMLVVHPLQAVGREVPGGGLVVGGMDILRRNLLGVLNSVTAANRTLRLMTLDRFARAWLRMETGEEAGKTAETAGGEKRETRYARAKGGTQRTTVEKEKAVRSTTKSEIRAVSRPPRRGPRKRRG